MRRLLIADVHANLPAFEAVLQDVGMVDEVIFLGDIVDYGPHPVQCVEVLQGLGARSIAGNHDLAVLAAAHDPPEPGEPVSWPQWTREQMADSQLAWMADLPETLTIAALSGQATVIHHPPGAPYLHPAMPDSVLAGHCREARGQIVMFGHSHYAMDRMIEGRRLVCVPSVGQPRDGDPRAGYAIERDGELSFHRVAYDVERVVADVRAIGLDPTFTARWVKFVRTGYDGVWSRPYRA